METTTQQAQHILDTVQQKYGFVPNLYREMAAHSPAVAEVYLQANEAADGISLTPQETQAVILAVSAYNDCHYCTKAHRTVGKMVGLPEDEIDAILGGDLPRDERLRSLVHATRLTLDKRGWLSDEDLEALASRGISRGQVYEIVALIGIKTISNYVNHIAHTEVDPQFK
ncbi:carboxymuconolactone decarboxylase family protein [Rhodocaloribacter litoris]|uniref:carboxymuconolactone decarboxylase family protein n=1 Tax=Rhodocaloribacter litoris TaxID=2558931 RepID=UPI0014204747|nr:carboxymuconolactone decarboxylase family protein [Rhodocaloribacter litoris]QXD14281.1 carboxymuconolactone decarboxylase family protein [Rhodocaloribacter litoris]